MKVAAALLLALSALVAVASALTVLREVAGTTLATCSGTPSMVKNTNLTLACSAQPCDTTTGIIKTCPNSLDLNLQASWGTYAVVSLNNFVDATCSDSTIEIVTAVTGDNSCISFHFSNKYFKATCDGANANVSICIDATGTCSTGCTSYTTADGCLRISELGDSYGKVYCVNGTITPTDTPTDAPTDAPSAAIRSAVFTIGAALLAGVVATALML